MKEEFKSEPYAFVVTGKTMDIPGSQTVQNVKYNLDYDVRGEDTLVVSVDVEALRMAADFTQMMYTLSLGHEDHNAVFTTEQIEFLRKFANQELTE